MTHAFICDAQRTPFGRYGGALSSVRTADLGAIPLAALMARNREVDWAAVSDVIVGYANQAGEDTRNVARMASLLAGLPIASQPGRARVLELAKQTTQKTGVAAEDFLPRTRDFLDNALAYEFVLLECPITFHPRVGLSKGGNINNWRGLTVGTKMIAGLVFGWQGRHA